MSPACREQVHRGQAPALLSLVRTWTGQTGAVDLGRSVACALQDDGSAKVLGAWLRDDESRRARSICLQSMATWPAAEPAWKPALDRAVRKVAGAYYVDPAVQALAAEVPRADVRERLVPVLRAADDRHASGFEQLRRGVCVVDPEMSAARRQTCSDLVSRREADWRRPRPSGDTHPAATVIVASALYAGAVALTYAAREQDAGRGIATGAGAVGGATLGIAASGLVALGAGTHSRGSIDAVPALLLGGAIAGGVLGGIAAHSLAREPSNRTAVTAVSLAVPYLLTLAITFN